jgi:hypothetical protein
MNNEGQQNQIASPEDVRLGESLVRKAFADARSEDVEDLGKMIAPGFQSVHVDGARDRQAEIELFKGLDIHDYTLSDFKVTRVGPALIVTYFLAVAETIDGKRLSAKPSARLSVWLETDSGWKWIAHANLKPLE